MSADTDTAPCPNCDADVPIRETFSLEACPECGTDLCVLIEQRTRQRQSGVGVRAE